MPFDLKKQFAFDAEKATDGVWIPLEDSDARLLIGKLGTERYNRALRESQKPYRYKIQTGTLNDEDGNKILAQTTASGLLLGWEGIEYDNAPLPYTPAHALKMCQEFPGFRDLVRDYASDLANFQAAQDDGDQKNSVTPSAGGLSGDPLLTD